MKYTCHGNFAEAIHFVVAEKRNFGYSYETMENVLKRFDKFSIDRFPNKEILDKEIVMAWACKMENEGDGNFQNRIGAVRELARFIIRNGGEAFVIPAGIGGKPSRRVPHIFSEEELKAIFKQTDTLRKPFNLPSIKHLIVPVIFRLLYSCGMRPSEVLNLKVQHVNLEIGVIFVDESKGHKDRRVVCSSEVQQLLIKFNRLAEAFVADRLYFFPKPDGNCYSLQWLEKIFQEILGKANLITDVKPRLYDFRHPYVKYTTKNNCDNLIKIFVCTEPIKRTSAKGIQSQSCYRGKRKPALSASQQVI